MQNEPNSPDQDIGRLRWRCRRGVRELDVLLSGFISDQYHLLDTQERHCLDKLLDTQDPLIMDWLFGRQEVPDADLANLVERIRGSASRESS